MLGVFTVCSVNESFAEHLGQSKLFDCLLVFRQAQVVYLLDSDNSVCDSDSNCVDRIII